MSVARHRSPAALVWLLLLAAIALNACGHDGESTGGAAPGVVSQSTFSVPGSLAAPNPAAGVSTPAELNRAWAQVYEADGIAPAEVRKVLVLMPGFLGGAGNFDYLARRVLERSGGRTAVWAVDRRSNALEDHTGLDAAEARRDPDIAKRYYFGGEELNGRTFAGFVRGSQARYVSEWGLKVHVEDLDALISAAMARYPGAAVFLGGHSLGASIVPIYAAWDFGTHAGFERLSGLILLEGAPNPAAATPSRQAYESSGIGGGFGRSSLQAIRGGNAITTLEPFVTTDLFVTAEILAMRAHSSFGTANQLSPDADLYTGFLGLLFGLTEVPAATNRAVLGFGFDNDFQPLSFARVSIGSATGGPIGDNPNAAFLEALVGASGTLLAPISATATYDWQGAATDAPNLSDPTDLDDFAAMLFRGPSNFIEWYFPARISLDASITNMLNVQPSGDWRKEVYGLAVTENARVDVPVFAAGGSRGLLPDLERLTPYRDSISDTLRNGSARRGSMHGFRTMLMERHVHIDVLSASDEGVGGNGLFSALVEWMDEAVHVAPRR
jgi:pimeloyl-ACP methyl ester carboxylesterase